MLGQDDDGVDQERVLRSYCPECFAQYIDMPNEQISAMTLGKIDGEEIGSAGYAGASVGSHRERDAGIASQPTIEPDGEM